MRDVQQAKLAARLEAHGIKVEWHGHTDEVPQRGEPVILAWQWSRIRRESVNERLTMEMIYSQCL